MSSIRLSRRKVLSAAALFGILDAVGFNVLPASASPSPIGVHDASNSAQSAVPQPVFFKRGHKLETGFQAEIRSPLLGEIRALRIRMPDRQKAALKGVHVLYLLDGETFFAAAAAYAQWLEQSRLGIIGGVMVAGIVNKENRTRDLTPSASAADRQGRLDPAATLQGGGAGRFLDFITGELRQSVEAQLPDGMRILRRTLIGHSFGGLFTVNAVLTQPHAFDDFIAADPSFWWDQRRLIQKAAADGLGDKAAAGPGRRLYLGFATKPRKDRTASAERPAAGARLSADPLVSDFIGKLESQGMQVRRQDFPDEVHGTVMFPALFDALKHFYTRELS